MNTSQAIYTEKNNCQDCYKCVRRCPVKAIKIEKQRASVIDELCIYCGKCVEVCPSGAKKIRNDISSARFLMRSGKKIVLSIAPSWPIAFADYTDDQLRVALQKAGFYAVSETALGADLVSEEAAKLIENSNQNLWLSSCCPVIVQLMRKFYPEHLKYLMPLPSPMQAHAQYLKHLYGEDIAVVFAGPCIAKKTELNEVENHTDIALTFDELRSLLADEALTPDFLPQENNSPTGQNMNRTGALYPVDGGMIAGMHDNASITETSMMTFSGVVHVRSILDELDAIKGKKLFLELLACKGGCVNGPGNSNKKNIAAARIEILNRKHVLQPEPTSVFPELTLKRKLENPNPPKVWKHSEADIRQALASVDKLSKEDELNCSGCGYRNCRDFACAMIEGKAERLMCVSYMRKVAQNKASVLLQKIPYGVVTVDEQMHIIESNEPFARFLGEEAERIYQTRPGMQGSDLNKLLPFARIFQSLLLSGEESVNKDIRFKNELFHLSVFSIQKHKIVCGIIHKMNTRNGLSKEMHDRLYKAIYDNMMTAQKAAALLGENASNTEFLLQSVLEASKK